MINTRVTALGEILMDMTPQGDFLYKANPGGAPANVLVQLSKLGMATAFIGKVGQDRFGEKLRDLLKEEGVNCDALYMDPVKPTTLAFVHLSDQGDRSFSFYRDQSADQALCKEEVPLELLESSDLLHFGSLSFTVEPMRSATFYFLDQGKKMGKMISYDPNLRENLWSNLQEAKSYILKGMAYADLVKISEEELYFLKGQVSIPQGAKALMQDFPQIQILLITRGAQGADLFTSSLHLHEEALDVPVVDTTGAGDSFLAGFLSGYLALDESVEQVSKEQWTEILHFANLTASLVITRKGAIPAMGDRNEILQLDAD